MIFFSFHKRKIPFNSRISNKKFYSPEGRFSQTTRHVVMLCNGNGKIPRKPFSVKNSPEGKDYLLDQVTKSCLHHGIKPEHLFYGGEDCGSYADNFIFALRSENLLVAGVNAHDAKKQRENMQACTDRLDLMGICKLLKSCRGNCSPAQSRDYLNLRTLVR